MTMQFDHRTHRLARGALAACIAAALATSCILSPQGTRAEQSRVHEIGQAYEPRLEARSLPEISAQPGWRELLQRAFLVNGDIESAFFAWQAAVQRIDVAAAWPNTNVALDFEYLFSGGRMKSWDRTTIGVGFDPMQNLALPTKVQQSGKVALAQARSSGERFRAAKFELQRQVLDVFADCALLAERIEIQGELLELSQATHAGLASRMQTGASSQQLLQLALESSLAENSVATLRTELGQRLAELNALAGREAKAPVDLRAPEPRAVPVSDAELLALGAATDPELAALAHEVEGRADALERVRMEYWPDITPFAAFTGGVSQVLGASLSIPANLARLRAEIDEARAQLRSAEAAARQTRARRGARFVAELLALRNAERQTRFLEDVAVPLATRLEESAQRQYTLGGISQQEWITSRRAALELRELSAETRAARERALAALEALAGIDFETLAREQVTVHE